MGIFEFECPAGHITSRMTSHQDRPEKVQCDECKQEATFVLSATPTTFRAMDRKAFKRSGR